MAKQRRGIMTIIHGTSRCSLISIGTTITRFSTDSTLASFLSRALGIPGEPGLSGTTSQDDFITALLPPTARPGQLSGDSHDEVSPPSAPSFSSMTVSSPSSPGSPLSSCSVVVRVVVVVVVVMPAPSVDNIGGAVTGAGALPTP
jgi:hypothetical protein